MVSTTPVIMLVDDDPDFLEMNRRVLEAKGCKVVCFSDSQAAFEQMGRERPHLVIADLMIKSLDSGFSFSRTIKEDPRLKGIPVVIVTAITRRLGLDFNPATPAELAAMHADAYFDKPVNPQTLWAKVEELLN